MKRYLPVEEDVGGAVTGAETAKSQVISGGDDGGGEAMGVT